jgi:LacI family gluconate utilization system Gnt-I transcriptional repressor
MEKMNSLGQPDGQYPVITMSDVAHAANVSPMTVSNAFRYPERVQEETRLRVLEVAATLGYLPNMSAGHLAARKSRIIGSTLPSLKNASFYQYITGLQDEANARGHKVVFMLTDTLEQELEAVHAFIGMRVTGIILIGNEHKAATVDILRKARVPTVETWLLHDPVDRAIGYDIADAIRTACRRHINAGRRRIGLISNDDPASRRFRERPPVFREEMCRAGLRDDLVVNVTEPHAFEAGPAALEELLALDANLDAVICPTDIVAAGVLWDCARRGISVPERLGIIGWGDYEIAQAVSPKLTTIKPNPMEIGVGAVRLLLDGAGDGETTKVDTGYSLIERESA